MSHLPEWSMDNLAVNGLTLTDPDNRCDKGDDAVTNWRNPYNRQISHEEQQLYDHLLHRVQVESPSQLIKRYRALFIDGVDYSDHQILLTLDQITTAKSADTEFKFVLNRCWHILINRWQMQPQLQKAIPELLALFECSPAYVSTHCFRYRAVKRLHELVRLFTQSEQYLSLRRLAQIMSQPESDTNPRGNAGTEPLGALIRRYPYLYQHCLITEDCTSEHQRAVRVIQGQVQRKFEIDLSQYVTYQVRCASAASKSTAAPRIIQPVKNPTLLSDGELNGALKQFVGKVQGSHTYYDLAQSFLTHSRYAPSFHAFKGDLYEYLTSSLDLGQAKHQFNDRLYAHLQHIIPESDPDQLNDFLLVRTCSQLLNFLVVESPTRPHHYVFVDLITNLGTTLTTGLLLKIVLLCRKVKPYLEKRFSILFNHYESAATGGVQWLVQTLEKLNLALSIHFGGVDLPCLNQIL